MTDSALVSKNAQSFRMIWTGEEYGVIIESLTEGPTGSHLGGGRMKRRNRRVCRRIAPGATSPGIV